MEVKLLPCFLNRGIEINHQNDLHFLTMNQNLNNQLLNKWFLMKGKENEKSKMAEIIC